ncbi:erythromycin esterase family protein [Nonomuraea gerenzanensis]|uniref:Protein-L-isoaspartate O-methyltransferase n=1 Tax=Nonomuraea gerenzanensis TaxID=93944 RepID=A0A1M4ED93_9ACTN|nr:erythromycin esterase family protein [Nonomuraea gerenzanensis]SBO96947.1 Protein-L-isoaspartate O-methyltransferase [Nonomuraea gerenzanensis]
MSQDIRDFIATSCDLLALGEPTHAVPAFGHVRNALLAQLAEHGFRSIALETDRVAALAVDDYVREGIGDLDTVLTEGFSHGWGAMEANRELVTWMREHNRNRPPQDRLAFHGFDAPTENFSAPSPRPYLEHARDYLGLDLDLAVGAGDDERWSRTEAIMDPARSPGASAEARRLRAIAGDLLAALDAREPAAGSRAAWLRARTHLTAGLALLRYHKQAAVPLDQNERVTRLSATRDAIMAQNLLDLRAIEAGRGPTLVHAHNSHLQKSTSSMSVPGLELRWIGAGALVAHLLGDRYAFVAGSLGRSEPIGVTEPDQDTFEGHLQARFTTWGLAPADLPGSARTRTDTGPQRNGYFPLDAAMLDGADAVMHLADSTLVRGGVSHPA